MKVKKRIKLALPSVDKREGPKIYLSRLKENLESRGLIKTTHFLNPLHDIALFATVARSFFFRPYVLRLDGFYFDSEETCGSNQKFNAPIIRAIKRARGLIYQSNFDKKFIERRLLKTNKPYKIIPNGVDLNVFTPQGENCRDILGIPQEHKVLVTSASWRAHKRLDDILKVFLLLRDSGYDDLHLLILGNLESEQPTSSFIHFTGLLHPKELPKWYRTGDVFIFLSWLDHCPNVVIEAVASGLPVVCTNQGGTREIVERSNSGIVVEVDQPFNFTEVALYNPPHPDIGKIKTAAETLFNNLPAFRNQINYHAVDINNIADQYIEFFYEILNK